MGNSTTAAAYQKMRDLFEQVKNEPHDSYGWHTSRGGLTEIEKMSSYSVNWNYPYPFPVKGKAPTGIPIGTILGMYVYIDDELGEGIVELRSNDGQTVYTFDATDDGTQ